VVAFDVTGDSLAVDFLQVLSSHLPGFQAGWHGCSKLEPSNADFNAKTQRGCRNQSEELRQKEGNGLMGRGMFGRGIKLRDFLPIPLPIIPLPNPRRIV
jgi:hypothetical protein